MTRSAWLLPALASVLFVLAMLYPAASVIGILLEPKSSGVEIRPLSHLFWTTMSWSALVGIGAVVLGWLPGRVLRGTMRSGNAAVIAFVLVPICLPAYIVFYAWWQGWPADSSIYRWAVEQEMIVTLRHLTLLVSLWCWSWPLVALCVIGAHDPAGDAEQELLQIDGASRLTIWLSRLRSDTRGLVFGFVVVFLITFNNTTCFDLSEIFTFGNELRAIRALGATNYEATLAAWPAVLISLIGCIIIWALLTRTSRAHLVRTPRTAMPLVITAAAIWLLSWAVPFAILLGGGAWLREVSPFIRLYGSSVVQSIALALCGGSMVMIVAVGSALAWQDSRAWVRHIFTVQAIGWILTAALPGTFIGLALEAAYNHPGPLHLIYASPAILVLAYVARFAFVAALFGRWVVLREPANLRDMRQVDGCTTLRPLLRALWPRLLAAGGASMLIVTVMSLGEIAVTAAVHPPGSDPLALALLNAMHYQRPQTVTIAGLLLIASALVVALMVLRGAKLLRRRMVVTLAASACVASTIAMSGCEDHRSEAPLDTEFVFGSTGLSLGQFSYPRAIATDPTRDYVYIVDKTARVQRFGLDGEPQLEWDMPAKEYGKPTGISVAPDGRVFVADTHYWRIIAYDENGRELMRFGSYGEADGQFIYPTDVAFGPNDTIYVAEYGGNDRIQVFDAAGNFLFKFGSPGAGPGEFTRPQSIDFSHDRSELYITDSCNHRIIVTDPQGKVLRTIGEPGRGPGQLQFPYSLAVLSDGTLLVCEFGGNRLQRLAPDGTFLGMYGRLGAGEGELQYPWAVDVADGKAYVLDSGNNRVQVIDDPAD